jgi:hypothetical protein
MATQSSPPAVQTHTEVGKTMEPAGRHMGSFVYLSTRWIALFIVE